MKKTLRMMCCFLCMLSVVLITLSSCDLQNMFGGSVNVPKGDGFTPMYYGMLMSTSSNVEIPPVSYEDVVNEINDNNGNHNGWYKNPNKDKENNGNTDNNGNHYGWYKDDNGDGKLDEDFQQQICYLAQNQDVYFYVGIGNPAQQEIRSITINGKTYTNDMFEANSTNEVKILKHNVGNSQGIVEYTIDEIKYFDGTEVKDVVIAGNRTAKAGIKAENAVTANVTTIELRDSGKEIFFDVTITDEYGLIANSNGSITLTVYRDGKSVKSAELVVGKNEVTIQTLNKNKEHEYEIVAYYDDLSGEGATYHTLISRRPVQEIHIHTFGEWTVTKEVSCFVDGEKTHTCTACGEIETEIIPAPDKHTWGEWKIVKEASCAEDGEKTRICSACDETETEIMPAHDKHSFGEWKITKEASCAEDGEKIRICSACDETETEIMPAHDKHSFGEWATTKKATCTEKGEKTRTCSVCGKTEIETIPTLAHNYVNLVCSECGKTASCEDGHSYQIDLFNNPARFENRWGVCEFCGYIEKLHEHILQNGKCKYCDEFELHEVQFKSVFDFDEDGQKDVFTMANTLPEKFRADGAIHMSASKENLSTICVTYDEVRAGWVNPMPYVHHFVNEQDKENSYLLYKITVEEAGIYELGIHIRLKDARYRGATFFVNGKKALEFSYGWNVQDISLTEEQMSLRSNDLLKGSYIYGITIELEKGENEIRITSPEECSHSMHFRDFYFVKKQTTPPVEHEHEWVKSITPPTAMANGVITYTCSCGDSYTETIVPTDFTVTAENRAMVGFTGEANEKLVIPAVFEDNGTWYRVVAIGDGAFIASRLLLNVTIPNTVTNIGSCAFNSCSALQSIIIPDSVTDLGDKQFDGCSSLISVTIGSGISRIKYYTFAGCSFLISVVIPNSITRIDEQVFYYCDALAYIYFEGSENEWNSITVGYDNNDLLDATRYYYSETKPTTEGNYWHYVDGVPTVWEAYVKPNYSIGLEYTSNGDGTCYVSGMGTCTDTDVIIPEVSPNGDTVIGIGYDAFGWDDNLVSVVIPDTVTNIGFYAFNACPYLTSITIGRGVTYIEWGAFPYCKALKNFTVVEGNTAYYVEGNCLIERSSKALIKGSADSTIPQDIEMIVHFSFASCENLTHITIPKSVTKIHYNAFDCCFDLASITFEGTVAEWNAIDKETGWDSSMSQYIVDCIDGTISKDGTVTYKSEVQMLYEAAMRLNHEESLEGVCTLTGIVTVVNNVYLEHYQNIDVTIMVDGYSFYCFHLRGDGVKELGIGDTITVTGSINKYNYWVEFGRFCQLDSRIPNAGGDPDCAHNYIDGVVCSCGHIKETNDPEPDTVLTIQEANELGLSKQWRHPTHGRYYVVGVIESIINTNGKHGNMYIRDEEGNTLYLYSLFNADGSKRFDVMDNQPAVGDTITVYGALSQYEGEAQMINAFMVERIPCEE